MTQRCAGFMHDKGVDMPSRDRQADITNQLGPSWYDCRVLAADIERDFGGKVQGQFGPSHISERWKYRAIHCRLEFIPTHEGKHNRMYAAATFQGNDGAKTFTGAFYAALLNLWDRLEARNEEALAPAQEALPF